MHEIMTIWMKELRDTIRDRRTLLVMVLVPVLLTPAMIVGMGKLMQASSDKPVHVAVSGGAAAPQLPRLLAAQPKIVVDSRADAARAVKDGKDDAGLIIAPDFAARIAAGKAGHVTVVSDSTQFSSSRAVIAATQDVATKQAQAGFILGLIVPMFLVIYSMVGGMYTAMDLSAGEKERFTLEALCFRPPPSCRLPWASCWPSAPWPSAPSCWRWPRSSWPCSMPR